MLAEAINFGARVYVNGEIVGHHEDPQTLVENLRRLRRSGSLSSQMNVAYFEDTNEIFMNTDSGRARRPLIVVENGKAMVTEEHVTKIEKGEMTFADLVASGLVSIWMPRRRRTASSPSGKRISPLITPTWSSIPP